MSVMILFRGARSISGVATIACLLMISGCGRTAGDKVATPQTSPQPANEGSVVAANNASPAPQVATPQDNIKPAAATPAQGTKNKNSPSAVSVPQPQVGTGAGDFFLFTQARAALNADAELRKANIIIDVRAGAVTLSGTVASAAQKSTAEQLTRAVAGVKGVTNRLRVSS